MQHAQPSRLSQLWVQQIHHIPVPAFRLICSRRTPALAPCTNGTNEPDRRIKYSAASLSIVARVQPWQPLAFSRCSG